MTSILYDGNDHVVRLKGLKDSAGEDVTAATVEATLFDGEAEVPGQAWPLVLTADGTGNYTGVLDSAVQVTVGKRYSLHLTATIGTTEGEWREYVVVRRRDFRS